MTFFQTDHEQFLTYVRYLTHFILISLFGNLVKALFGLDSVNSLSKRVCVVRELCLFIQGLIQSRIKTILCSTPHSLIQDQKFASINKRPSSLLPLFFRSSEIKSILGGPTCNFCILKSKSEVSPSPYTPLTLLDLQEAPGSTLQHDQNIIPLNYNSSKYWCFSSVALYDINGNTMALSTLNSHRSQVNVA